ncbi:nucleotide pyrophosphohydrolase [Amycolatopsis cihanbeyliensis]|uniref:NTP pyrophosphatase (Non-canonical NTP hydrolase) n=1 Tax=Amycolatopsis cihanbeyliensis TaxID=1128664 RepID=A0A542DEW7_AMYCI|nr:nucleotide pyrophosphohydrolase [Amycolatopsis cihanbeyliensis]TQJ01606.1 NTP pyrophosphatase (non-canonical NTP hydrolase) [Amycolatopsis cihanbeyliensis]
MEVEELVERLRSFAQVRDWEQFHNPKNLVMALTGEVGELAELFQWLTPAESARVMDDPGSAERVRHEIADVLAYLLRLADVLQVDVVSALADKITVNEAKYPVDLARGSAAKYDQL